MSKIYVIKLLIKLSFHWCIILWYYLNKKWYEPSNLKNTLFLKGFHKFSHYCIVMYFSVINTIQIIKQVWMKYKTMGCTRGQQGRKFPRFHRFNIPSVEFEVDRWEHPSPPPEHWNVPSRKIWDLCFLMDKNGILPPSMMLSN